MRTSSIRPWKLFLLQAEAGIRGDLVTGVQTCALPIFTCVPLTKSRRVAPSYVTARCVHVLTAIALRSEERRVGKECRSRGSPHHYTGKVLACRQEDVTVGGKRVSQLERAPRRNAPAGV